MAISSSFRPLSSDASLIALRFGDIFRPTSLKNRRLVRPTCRLVRLTRRLVCLEFARLTRRSTSYRRQLNSFFSLSFRPDHGETPQFGHHFGPPTKQFLFVFRFFFVFRILCFFLLYFLLFFRFFFRFLRSV